MFRYRLRRYREIAEIDVRTDNIAEINEATSDSASFYIPRSSRLPDIELPLTLTLTQEALQRRSYRIIGPTEFHHQTGAHN